MFVGTFSGSGEHQETIGRVFGSRSINWLGEVKSCLQCGVSSLYVYSDNKNIVGMSDNENVRHSRCRQSLIITRPYGLGNI